MRTWARRYLGDLWRTSPSRCLAAFALSVAATVTESIGLLLLIPLVAQLGVAPADGEPADWVSATLESFGVPNTLGWILIVYVGLITVRAVIEATRRGLFADLAFRLENEIRASLFEAAARATWTYHLQRRGSDLSLILGSEVTRIRAGTSAVFDVLSRVVATTGYLIVAIRLSATVTFVAGAVLALALVALSPALRMAHKTGEVQTRRGLRTFAAQQEFLDNVKVVKSHGDEERHIVDYRHGLQQLQSSLLSYARLSATTTGLLQVAVAGAIALVTWIAVTELDTSGARLIVLIVVIARLAPLVSTVIERGQTVNNMLPAYALARRWTDEARDAQESVAAVGVPFPAPVEVVELDKISYSYRDDRAALSEVSLRIPIGGVIGVVGPSGAGKTTLVDMTLGLLRPDSGRLLVDGVEIQSDQLEQWRRHVAYVPQENSLFHTSIRENITLSQGELGPKASQRLDQLLRQVALDGVVNNLPDGIDTVVGDRGTRLSGGERQRVALARALWREPSLLVLDEATSALDRENELLVLDAVAALQGRVAMLVVAHRLDTIRHADEIIVVDGGAVVERGTWDELSRSGEVFGRLAQR